MDSNSEFDVAVVGASVAGCTAARLFAQSGARVALIEQRNDPAAYKVVCTHAILTPSTPTIERLGLAPMLTERGVPRTWAEFWTPYGGWFGLPGRTQLDGCTARRPAGARPAAQPLLLLRLLARHRAGEDTARPRVPAVAARPRWCGAVPERGRPDGDGRRLPPLAPGGGPCR